MNLLRLTAFLVLSAVSTFGASERSTATEAQISSFTVALETFEIDCGRYPTTAEGLEALVARPPGISENLWKGPYLLKQVPNDPWGHGYVYTCPGIHNTNGFDVYSRGMDGVSKTGGDDAGDTNNWDFKSPHQADGVIGLLKPSSVAVGGVVAILSLLAACWFGRRSLRTKPDWAGVIAFFWVAAAIPAILLTLLLSSADPFSMPLVIIVAFWWAPAMPFALSAIRQGSRFAVTFGWGAIVASLAFEGSLILPHFTM